jgi:hypothetical protein
MGERLGNAAKTAAATAAAAASAGTKVLENQVQDVANLYKDEGITGVAKQVVTTQVVSKIADAIGPAILAAGLARGINGKLTAPSPLSLAAKPYGDVLAKALEKGDFDAAKLAALALFEADPETKRKDLADHLHGCSGFVAELLSQKLNKDREEQPIITRWTNRVASLVNKVGQVFNKEQVMGETFEDRIKTVCDNIDLVMADMREIEAPVKPLLSSSAAAAATKSNDDDLD